MVIQPMDHMMRKISASSKTKVIAQRDVGERLGNNPQPFFMLISILSKFRGLVEYFDS